MSLRRTPLRSALGVASDLETDDIYAAPHKPGAAGRSDMYATLTVRDETLPGVAEAGHVFTLSFPSELVTVEELIRERVRQEVERYNAERPDYFRGLVQPGDAERTLNGYRLPKQRRIDCEEQMAKAVAAFRGNGFLLLVDDRQVDELDEVIAVRPETTVTFLKLVPLVGG
jgi:hypothetical protein